MGTGTNTAASAEANANATASRLGKKDGIAWSGAIDIHRSAAQSTGFVAKTESSGVNPRSSISSTDLIM